MNQRPEQLTLDPRAPVVATLRPMGLTIREAARYLGVSRWTVQRLRSQGRITGYHVGAGAFVTLDSLDRYVAEQAADRDGG